MPGYRYKGPDRFFSVPARDLTEAEFNALPASVRRDVRASDSYVESTAKELVNPDAESGSETGGRKRKQAAEDAAPKDGE